VLPVRWGGLRIKPGGGLKEGALGRISEGTWRISREDDEVGPDGGMPGDVSKNPCDRCCPNNESLLDIGS